jgi:hypothetical protein
MNSICYWCMRPVITRTDGNVVYTGVSATLLDMAPYSPAVYQLNEHLNAVEPMQMSIHFGCRRMYAAFGHRNALLHRRLAQFARLPFMQFLDFQQTMTDLHAAAAAVRSWLTNDVCATLERGEIAHQAGYRVGTELTIPADAFVVFRSLVLAIDTTASTMVQLDDDICGINSELIEAGRPFADTPVLQAHMQECGIDVECAVISKWKADSVALHEAYNRRVTAAIGMRLCHAFYLTLTERCRELGPRLRLPTSVLSPAWQSDFPAVADVQVASPCYLQLDLMAIIGQSTALLNTARTLFASMQVLHTTYEQQVAAIAFDDTAFATTSPTHVKGIDVAIAGILDPIAVIESGIGNKMKALRRAFRLQAKHGTIDYLVHLLQSPSPAVSSSSSPSSSSSSSSAMPPPAASVTFDSAPPSGKKGQMTMPATHTLALVLLQLIMGPDYTGPEAINNISAILTAYDAQQ